MQTLAWVDYAIMLIYLAFVLGIGFALKRYMKTSTDFFLSGRSIPAWVAGLAFLSANLGAQEVIGMAASGAKYGISTSHFYWLGAIPAMVFVGIFMMPFYYGSRARSVPEYLRLRFDEKTRGLNAITFLFMTVMSSGISMMVMAKLIQKLGIFKGFFEQMGISEYWIFDACVITSALIVLVYVYLGGLTSAIYNEVLQFFMIVAGFLPLVWLGLKDIGGWPGLKHTLSTEFTHCWVGMGHTADNKMGVEWFGLAMGLGFVLSFGYWCTDFLVVQRAMAADSMSAARRTPLIAAFPKMLFPFLVIIPGLIAISLLTREAGLTVPQNGKGEIPGAVEKHPEIISPEIDWATQKPKLDKGQLKPDYNSVIPNLLLYYLPTGLLGIGLTALLASFMSGMAGNITAFNTVWTFDIYQAYIKRDGTDRHYLWMGHLTTFFGTAISIGAAYVALKFDNIMDLLQAVFAFVNAPLLATFLLGMFWKRATAHGAFIGLLLGVLAAAAHHGLTLPHVGDLGGKGEWLEHLNEGEFGWKGGWLSYLTRTDLVHQYPSEMAQAFWTAIVAWTTCFVATIAVSLVTKPRGDNELVGLVYSLTEKPKEDAVVWYKRPVVLGVIVLTATLILNIIFW